MSSSAVPSASPQERAWLALLLTAVAAVLLFRLGEAPVDVTAEHRVDVVMRTMVASGDWLVPRMGDELRLQKPPLSYWLSAGLAELGLGPTPLALRLPSALAGLLLVLLTYRWGRQLGGPGLGLLAAGLIAAMESFVALGRRGVAEMPLAAACTAAFLLWPELVDRRRRGVLPLFALCVTIAFLAKATAALFVLGLPIAVDLWLRGAWREALRWRNSRWIALALLLGFAWWGAIALRGGEAREQLVQIALLPLGVKAPDLETSARHYRSFTFFLAVLPQAASPAIFLALLFLSKRAWPGLRSMSAEQRWPWLVALAIFVGFSALPQKQKHYLLPMLPALALVLAQTARELLGARDLPATRWLRFFALFLGLAGVAVLVVVGAVYGLWLPGGWPAALGMLAAGMALLVLALRAAWNGDAPRFARSGIAFVLGFWMVWEDGIDHHLRQWKAGELRDASWRTAIQRADEWVHIPTEGSDPREEIPRALRDLEERAK
ncbi:MAG: glycosyltransferase family 39 protein [Planctomycetes bacterium]|nr:glycosyltransferase family 39 protein [Planctomycetota bacterium]